MLLILTDEQIAPEISTTAQKRCPGIRITTIFDCMEGHFVGAPDEEILREASRQSMTLLTFDLRTFPPVLRRWGEEGVDHGGVIFVDHKSFAQNDMGGISQSLCQLHHLHGNTNWKNRCFFLNRTSTCS